MSWWKLSEASNSHFMLTLKWIKILYAAFLFQISSHNLKWGIFCVSYNIFRLLIAPIFKHLSNPNILDGVLLLPIFIYWFHNFFPLRHVLQSSFDQSKSVQIANSEEYSHQIFNIDLPPYLGKCKWGWKKASNGSKFMIGCRFPKIFQRIIICLIVILKISRKQLKNLQLQAFYNWRKRSNKGINKIEILIGNKEENFITIKLRRLNSSLKLFLERRK